MTWPQLNTTSVDNNMRLEIRKLVPKRATAAAAAAATLECL